MNLRRRIHLLFHRLTLARRFRFASSWQNAFFFCCLVLLLTQQYDHSPLTPVTFSEEKIIALLRNNPYDHCFPALEQALVASGSFEKLVSLSSAQPYEASVQFHSFLEKSLRYHYYAQSDSSEIYARLAAQLAELLVRTQGDSFFLRRQKYLQKHIQTDPMRLRQWLLANAFFIRGLNLNLTNGALELRCFAYARAQFHRLGDEKKVADILWLTHFYRDRRGERAAKLQTEISRWLALSQRIDYRDGILEAYLARAEKYGEVGERDSALVYYDRAAALAERIGKTITLAHVLDGRVLATMERGDLTHATELVQRGLQFTRTHSYRYVEADLLEKRAIIHHLKQEYRAAMDTLDAAITLHRKVAERIDLPPLFLLQARMLFELHDFDAALVAADSALQNYLKLGDHAGQARTYALLGLMHAQVKNREAAIAYEQLGVKSLAQADTLVEVIDLWNHFGELRLRLNDTNNARAAFVHALQLSEKRGFKLGQAKAHLGLGKLARRIGNGDSARAALETALALAMTSELREILWQCHFHMAQLEERAGHNERALKHYHAALQELEKTRNNIARLEFHLSYFSTVQEVFDHAIAFAIDGLHDAELALRFMEQSRGRALLKQLQPSAGYEPLDQHFAAQSLVRTFDDSTAALAYRVTEAGSYWVFVHRGKIAAQRLPWTREQLAQKVGKIRVVLGVEQREAFANRLRQNREALIVDTEQACFELYQDLLAPLAMSLRGVRSLYIIADGPLHYLPFGALLPQRGGPFLIEKLDLAFAPSLSVLKILREEKMPFAARRVQQALVLALASQTIPNTVTEAAEVAQLLGGAKEQVHRKLSRQQLAALLEEPHALTHLALHADINDALPFYSYLILDEGREKLQSTKLSWFAALRQSITAQRASPFAQERLFLVSDLFPLALHHKDLIVLSACNTALGQEISGEGMMGLTQGFLYAGAARLITSLWAVDDQRTFELMKYFYAALIVEQQPPGRALRAAQIKLLRDLRTQYPGYPFPMFWSAFVLTGSIY